MSRLRTRRTRLLAACALPVTLAAGSCAEGPRDPAAATVRSSQAPLRMVVDRRPQGRIADWGASVVTDFGVDPLVVPEGLSPAERRRLDRLIFRVARIGLVRVFGPGYGTTYGNVSAPRVEPAKLAFMRRARRLGVRFVLTGAGAPASMKQGNGLAPGSEEAYAGFLADVLSAGRAAGAPFAYVSIANEPSRPESQLSMSPAQAAAVSETLARAIRNRRLRTRLVLGDDIGWATSLHYARAALRGRTTRLVASVLASHDYVGGESERRALARFASRARLRVWQTEWGAGCPNCADDRTMVSGLAWSRRISTALVAAGTAAWFPFRAAALDSHGPQDALLVQRDPRHGGRGFYLPKRFHVFRHYASAARPGSTTVRVRFSASSRLFGLGFRARGGVAVVITNPGVQPRPVEVGLGRVRGTIRLRRTTPRGSFAAAGSRSYRGRSVRIVLSAQSVTTLALTPR